MDLESNEETAYLVLSVEDNNHYQQSLAYSIDQMRIRGRPIELLTAQSVAQGKELLLEHPNISVLLVDMIMEKDTSGLELIEFARFELKDPALRIVMLTGEPKIAPRNAMIECDIDEYWLKSELNNDRLYAVLSSQTRTWQALKELERHQQILQTAVTTAQQASANYAKKYEDLVNCVNATMQTLQPSVTPLLEQQGKLAKSVDGMQNFDNAVASIDELFSKANPTILTESPCVKAQDFSLHQLFSELSSNFASKFEQQQIRFICPSKPLPVSAIVNGYFGECYQALVQILNTVLTSTNARSLYLVSL